MSSLNDLYVVLEIVRSASEDDIKKAFRKLARRYHPDINPGDTLAEEHFKRISEAYEILSDPLKREFYDRNGFYSEGVLEHTEGKTTWGFTFKSFEFGSSPPPKGEMFSQFFSRRAARRDPERGQDLEYQMSIPFSDSISGVKAHITVQRRHSCTSCGGLGRASARNGNPCESCGGSGNMSRARGRLRFVTPCTECSGTGRAITDCPECGGESRVIHTDIVEAEIPAGVSAGSRVRYAGKGDAGRYGGPPGDLYVITNVTPHALFTRAGDNLQCVVPVTFVEAALGSKIEVPTVDGKAVVRIPPGTQNGQVLRLRGLGAPSLVQPGLRGDQFIEIQVVVPRIADEKS
ncbi:MAG TPA: DnaJ C-terminal domain-containing protein, partial [Terriglobia bacterium]|nr:DnaJ C-terminal domain-containing protein [Terriglobia bacterium]